MRKVRDELVRRFGEHYGREKFAWLLQRFNVMPWDDAPAAMCNYATA